MLVLVIDDSTMIRMQVKRALTGAGFEVVEARDGQDACDKLDAGAKPGLIVCDVNMPRMNGLEFLEQLQKKPAKGTPVVMLTTEGQPEMIKKARALGSAGWLVKPFKPELLISAATSIAAKSKAA
jgi:two-component system chemotaxis response regulator CheY